ncbi:MAG: HAMP domain-containing protein [Ktedonobacteraceae bacterium]|nr:HAMP domain-containing protein [Ktedonobacteraceae bacterium]
MNTSVPLPGKQKQPLFLSVSLKRASSEMLVLAGILWAASLFFSQVLLISLGILYRTNELAFLITPLSLLVFALRLRLSPELFDRQGWRNALVALTWTLLLSSISTISLFLSTSFQGTRASHAGIFVMLAIGFLTFLASYCLFIIVRLGLRLLLFWNRLRRRHLLWALTHSHVMLVVLVAGLCIFAIDAVAFVSSVRWNILFVLPLTLLLSIPSFIAMMLIVPPFALFSYFVIRRTTDRLRTLMLATAALRNGNYAVRVQVVGEDEVAQLQADFNAMASELERTMHALQEERDRVAALLQERRQLIANVSHELRTPVATLRGYLETTLIHWNGTTPSNLHHDLRVMEDEVMHLQARVEDLFMLARAEVGVLRLRPEPTAVGLLVRRIVDTRAPLAWRSSRIDVVADVPPHLPEAMVDAARLEQAILNLLHNGIRHTSPGGIVAVVAYAEPQYVVIQVKDTGEGISPQDLPHIWERFYQTASARARGGTGLGLSLVKEWIEGMGGSVSAESVPGEGSTFTLRVPRAPVSETAQAVTQPRLPAKVRQG